jgi:hypothetical protein
VGVLETFGHGFGRQMSLLRFDAVDFGHVERLRGMGLETGWSVLANAKSLGWSPQERGLRWSKGTYSTCPSPWRKPNWVKVCQHYRRSNSRMPVDVTLCVDLAMPLRQQSEGLGQGCLCLCSSPALYKTWWMLDCARKVVSLEHFGHRAVVGVTTFECRR